MFHNRQHAGQLLARKILERLQEAGASEEQPTGVIAIPRGGVIVASEVSAALGVPLGILVAQKIAAPFDPQLSIGAVTSAGVFVINDDLEFCTRDLGKYIERERVRLTELSRQLQEKWSGSASLQNLLTLKGGNILLVDDGVATGMTALAAVRSLRLQEVRKIILATPLMAAHAQDRLTNDCDSIINLACPRGFASMAHYYNDFPVVEENEMIAKLQKANEMLLASAN